MGNITRVNDRLLVWGFDGIDPAAISQACDVASMPFVVGHASLMPDGHVGYGPIGLVLPTKGAVVPSLVGVDIGCGMIALETNLTLDDLPDSLDKLYGFIAKAIPAGVGQGFDARDYAIPDITRIKLSQKELARAEKQFGTLGSGNHFVELCSDERGHVWLVLHSGSRGVGNLIAKKHMATARELMKLYHIKLDDPTYSYLPEGTPEFDEYINDMLWAQDYAMGNRVKMMRNAFRALVKVVPQAGIAQQINCHHNYCEKEHHLGQDVWLTRKGAIRMRIGDMGVIPGSMGTASYIVRGLQSDAAFHSASHGAGRTMSRRKARESFDPASLRAAMGDRTWGTMSAKKLLDEHPAAYKSIQSVMAAQTDLCQIEHELTQILNFKGA
jgi:tRNA-splicing ligase RtcB (3'-phosphate/5'-hydroxy nucleic acid ligase)